LTGADILPYGWDQSRDRLQLERKNAGMPPPEMTKLWQLEDENARLKKIVAC